MEKILNDEELKEIYSRLRPVVSLDGIKFLLREYALNELRGNTAYYWNKNNDKKEVLDRSKISVTGEYSYLSKYDNPLSYNIGLDEILNSIPEELKSISNAFEVEGYPTIVDDSHLVKVKTYKINK